jgi:hypothetical protein
VLKTRGQHAWMTSICVNWLKPWPIGLVHNLAARVSSQVPSTSS